MNQIFECKAVVALINPHSWTIPTLLELAIGFWVHQSRPCQRAHPSLHCSGGAAGASILDQGGALWAQRLEAAKALSSLGIAHKDLDKPQWQEEGAAEAGSSANLRLQVHFAIGPSLPKRKKPVSDLLADRLKNALSLPFSAQSRDVGVEPLH